MEQKQPKLITVVARRWFDRRAANTYHSVIVTVNGDLVGRVGFKYGYDEAYTQTAAALLAEKYPEYNPLHNGEALWRMAERNGDKLSCYCTDVARKKDL